MADAIRQGLAYSNAFSSLAGEKRFPEQVFVGQWEDFLFFESDLMFEQRFMDVANLLLREEQASVIALINLSFAETPEAFFLTRETKWADYHSKLVGDGTAINWVFLRDRYVCASDQNRWVIYCERQNDIAAFAFRGLSRSVVTNVQVLLKATSIRPTSTPTSADGFDFEKLVPYWRNTLMMEYGSNRSV